VQRREAAAHVLGEDVAAGRGPLGELDGGRPAAGNGGQGPPPPPVRGEPARGGRGEGGEGERAEAHGVPRGASAPEHAELERSQVGCRPAPEGSEVSNEPSLRGGGFQTRFVARTVVQGLMGLCQHISSILSLREEQDQHRGQAQTGQIGPLGPA
jgi:hypothetical protein